MIELDFKKDYLSKMNDDGLKNLLVELFGQINTDGNKYVVRFGAMQPMIVWISGKQLCIEITTDNTVDSTAAMKTIQMKNVFFERATGYTAKERLKKLKKGEK